VDFKILEKTETDKERNIVQYARSKMGALASDRESCVRVVTKKDHANGKALSLISNEDHPDCPKNTGAVRMEFFCASEIQKKGNDVHLTEFQQMDLKGYFPTMVMNKLMATVCLDR